MWQSDLVGRLEIVASVDKLLVCVSGTLFEHDLMQNFSNKNSYIYNRQDYSVVLTLQYICIDTVLVQATGFQEVCTVMVDNFRGLRLQTMRLRCHLAGICAATVLAGPTEAEDSLTEVTSCLRAAEFGYLYFFCRDCIFLCLMILCFISLGAVEVGKHGFSDSYGDHAAAGVSKLWEQECLYQCSISQ